MALPHLRNSEAGVNKYDPVHTNIFEVQFTVPAALQNDFAKDEYLLTQHIKSITGLNALNVAPGTNTQKFMGTDRSYIIPKLDSTRAEIKVVFTLNLRDEVDNYIYKLLRAWAALGYDVYTGSRRLKKDYCADWLNIAVANRAGEVYHSVIFKDVMMGGNLEGYDELNYETGDALEITCTFVSDWWQEEMA